MVSLLGYGNVGEKNDIAVVPVRTDNGDSVIKSQNDSVYRVRDGERALWFHFYCITKTQVAALKDAQAAFPVSLLCL